MSTQRRWFSYLSLWTLSFLTSPGVLGGEVTYTRMIASGQATPDGSGTFLEFRNPSLSNGRIAFLAIATPSGDGEYTTDGSTTYKIADLNTLYPGTSFPFIDFGQPVISGGQVAFVSRFSATIGDSGLFTAPSAGGPLQILADRNTPVPGGTGFMTPFSPPSFSNGNAVFYDRGTNSNADGIYLAGPDGVSVVANLSTPVPGGGSFISFLFDPSISGSNVAFVATIQPSFDQTIYLSSGGVLSMIASLATSIPGGAGTFTGLGNPVLGGDALAFRGSGVDGQQGIYAWLDGSLVKLVDLQSTVPGSASTFTGFWTTNYSVSTDGVSFLANDSSGGFGMYFADFASGELTKVIAIGDMLDGRSVLFPFTGLQSLDGREVAFTAYFEDGTNAIYVASIGPSAIPEPSSIVLALVGLTCLGVVGRMRRDRQVA